MNERSLQEKSFLLPQFHPTYSSKQWREDLFCCRCCIKYCFTTRIFCEGGSQAAAKSRVWQFFFSVIFLHNFRYSRKEGKRVSLTRIRYFRLLSEMVVVSCVGLARSCLITVLLRFSGCEKLRTCQSKKMVGCHHTQMEIKLTLALLHGRRIGLMGTVLR